MTKKQWLLFALLHVLCDYLFAAFIVTQGSLISFLLFFILLYVGLQAFNRFESWRLRILFFSTVTIVSTVLITI